jgi:hypothetical protein
MALMVAVEAESAAAVRDVRIRRRGEWGARATAVERPSELGETPVMRTEDKMLDGRVNGGKLPTGFGFDVGGVCGGHFFGRSVDVEVWIGHFGLTVEVAG